ncbi:MAG: hypothetical protein M3165_02365 [Actinomycetota bacterium]|nr:hypothetical protein [Actinomycetota bacterium]
MTARSRSVTAGVAVAVLAVVGTAVTMARGDAPDPPARAPADTAADRPARPAPPRRAGTAPAAPRDQGPGRDHRLTLPVQSFEVLAPNRLELRYATGVPACQGRLERAVAKEDDAEVVVVLLLRPPTAPPYQPCPEIALIEDAVVRLAAPLDGRRVVDGSTGRRVRRGHDDLY